MLIKYVPNLSWEKYPSKLDGYENQIILSNNNWDDYGYKTSFNLLVVLNNKTYTNWSVRILIEDEKYSASYLDQLCEKGWDGIFPIPLKKYLTLFSDIDFYKTLQSILGSQETQDILNIFNDAGYIKNFAPHHGSKNLLKDSGFSTSLLRDTGSHKAYEESWKIFDNQLTNNIKSFELNYIDKKEDSQKIKFNFTEEILPTDINVLIGSNGVGKSYTLRLLVEYILKIGRGDIKELEKNNFLPFDKRPNIANLILVSYSVFENFPIDLVNYSIKDKDSYKYFGIRARRSNDSNSNDFSKIRLGKEIPRIDATKSIFKMLHEDYQFQEQSWWINKFELAINTLKKAFQFDDIVLAYNDHNFIWDIKEIGNKKFIVFNEKLGGPENFSDEFNIDEFTTLEFIKDNKIIELSSGQKLFSYIVLNILGEIKKESLILIDEPELFLHPNLEIEFISLLKSILKPFNSKAILATHSLSIVREVPAKCVHIYKEDKEWGLQVSNPPFQTFGADMQRISTYVFGDKSITKPFEEWLENYFKKEDASADSLLEQLKGDINEEMIMDILRLEKKYGH